jgi:ribosome assembly protein RRB1
MGKKSKKRSSNGNSNEAKVDQNKQKRGPDRSILENVEEETKDNLRFEDPFEDEFEDEDDIMDEAEGGEEENYEDGDHLERAGVRSWNPLTCAPLDPGTKLEIDDTAYKMHHSLTPEWPSLSFEILRDSLGDQRKRFPHSMIVAVGSQADHKDRNKLTIMKMSDLARTGNAQKTEKEIEDEIMGEEIVKDGDLDEDEDESNDEDDESVDLDPVLEHYSLKHHGGVNRVRAMPQKPEIIATWSDVGVVNMYNVKWILDTFDRSLGTSNNISNISSTSSSRKNSKDPFFVYQGHGNEGYAMAWSPATPGLFASGDCDGHIHLWEPTMSTTNNDPLWSNSSFKVSKAYSPSSDGNIDNPSVEDIQWSPTESTVLAAAECGGYVKIYDTRCQGRPMLSTKIHSNGADVNVISWNRIVSNLLASGGDDGVFSVWDLRNFRTSTEQQCPQPLARFTCHKKPITSLEWHPSDESMIVVSDEDGTYIYDLSIEEDEDEKDISTSVIGEESDKIPPQLLFVHCGSESTKEAHWHPQITSLVMTTSLSGYSMFIPSNL